MTGGGQAIKVPLVVRTADGGGFGFGAEHSRATTENWRRPSPA
ncbi:hypothetical protein [Streptomyces sp. NBC_01314]|nr:hypothetical protein OG622_09215 [Streptomyces sp. NBC_01314]